MAIWRVRTRDWRCLAVSYEERAAGETWTCDLTPSGTRIQDLVDLMASESVGEGLAAVPYETVSLEVVADG